jgi:hypothetical protein
MNSHTVYVLSANVIPSVYSAVSVHKKISHGVRRDNRDFSPMFLSPAFANVISSVYSVGSVRKKISHGVRRDNRDKEKTITKTIPAIPSTPQSHLPIHCGKGLQCECSYQYNPPSYRSCYGLQTKRFLFARHAVR